MKNRAAEEPRVAIIVFPFAAKSVYNWASKVSATVSSAAENTLLISGGIPKDIVWPDEVRILDINVRLHYVNEKKPIILSAILWLYKFALIQVLFAKELFLHRKEFNVVFFTLGVYYQLPILLAKILRKKVITAAMGFDAQKAKISYGSLMAMLSRTLSHFNFALSDLIVVESLRLGNSPELHSFQKKLCNGAFYLDHPEKFCVQTEVTQRENIIGFVGRLVPDKGIIEFVNAIPALVEKKPDLKFLIIGSGSQNDWLEATLKKAHWASHITWLKWVEHNDLPVYFNQLKLLVMPSYDEGLPNILLEAMGCGVPILATRVGGIPDLVMENRTGFILQDLSEATIVGAIINAIAHEQINEITKNAAGLIEKKYNFLQASNRYKTIFQILSLQHTGGNDAQKE